MFLNKKLLFFKRIESFPPTQRGRTIFSVGIFCFRVSYGSRFAHCHARRPISAFSKMQQVDPRGTKKLVEVVLKITLRRDGPKLE